MVGQNQPMSVIVNGTSPQTRPRATRPAVPGSESSGRTAGSTRAKSRAPARCKPATTGVFSASPYLGELALKYPSVVMETAETGADAVIARLIAGLAGAGEDPNDLDGAKRRLRTANTITSENVGLPTDYGQSVTGVGRMPW